MSDVKRIDIKEFRELGFLQEANRCFFHPLGLALEIVTETCVKCNGEGKLRIFGRAPVTCEPCGGSGQVERLGGIWDYRDDPEGIYFEGTGLDPEKAAEVERERNQHVAHRIEFLKLEELSNLEWAVQPLESA